MANNPPTACKSHWNACCRCTHKNSTTNSNDHKNRSSYQSRLCYGERICVIPWVHFGYASHLRANYLHVSPYIWRLHVNNVMICGEQKICWVSELVARTTDNNVNQPFGYKHIAYRNRYHLQKYTKREFFFLVNRFCFSRRSARLFVWNHTNDRRRFISSKRSWKFHKFAYQGQFTDITHWRADVQLEQQQKHISYLKFYELFSERAQ